MTYTDVRFLLTGEHKHGQNETVDLGDELREFIESLIESGAIAPKAK